MNSRQSVTDGSSLASLAYLDEVVADAYGLDGERILYMLGRGATEVIRARAQAAARNGSREVAARLRTLVGTIVCDPSALTVHELVEACRITGTRLEASSNGFVWHGEGED